MVARFVRDEEAAGSNPVIPTTLNLSNQAVSEVFTLLEKPHFFEFDHMSTTFYASNAVAARLYRFFNYFLSLNLTKSLKLKNLRLFVLNS